MPIKGTVAWADITVPNATQLRDFYKDVVGWQPKELEVGGYSDYAMYVSPDGSPVAGICNAKGVNEGLPPQWIMYITVENLDESIKACIAKGGKLKTEPLSMGLFGKVAVIEDPAGAAVGLFEPVE